MSKVFIIQESPGKNLTPARDHGDLVVMLSGRETCEAAARKLHHHMREMTTEDHLLLIGNPAFMAIASHIAFSLCDGHVKLLVWDRTKQEYYVERIQL